MIRNKFDDLHHMSEVILLDMLQDALQRVRDNDRFDETWASSHPKKKFESLSRLFIVLLLDVFD